MIHGHRSYWKQNWRRSINSRWKSTRCSLCKRRVFSHYLIKKDINSDYFFLGIGAFIGTGYPIVPSFHIGVVEDGFETEDDYSGNFYNYGAMAGAGYDHCAWPGGHQQRR